LAYKAFPLQESPLRFARRRLAHISNRTTIRKNVSIGRTCLFVD
jgi:hypothetical protein